MPKVGLLHNDSLYGAAIVAIISHTVFSARADQAISAEKLLTVIVGAGAILSKLHSSS